MPSRTPVPLDPVDTLGYRRVSTEDQARDEKTSLPDQDRAIAALAARLGRALEAAHVFTDAGVSGQSAEDRPGFMALVRYAQEHPRPRSAPGYVLVLNASRFGRFRDPDEAPYWRTVLRRAGWIVRFAEGDETEDLIGRHVMRAISDAGASQYSHQLRLNTKRGARGAAAKGFWQNEAPMGYRRLATRANGESTILEVGTRKASDQVVRLTPGPEDEQELVRWSFSSYASGRHSLGSLQRELVVRWPTRQWSRRCVQAVLTNPAYVGDVVWCRRPHDKWERKETPVRPRSEWVVTRDAHPPIVPRDLFDTVQARLRENARTLRRTAGGYALSGLVVCGQCGKPYIGGGGVRGPADDPNRYRFYKCSGSQGPRPVCAGRMVTLMRRLIEPAVIETVAEVVAHPKVQRRLAQWIDLKLSTLESSAADERQERARRVAELESERERLVSAIGRGVLTDQEAAVRLEAVRDELAQLARAAERSRFGARTIERLAEQRDRFVEIAANFAERARVLEGAALREFLRPWIHSAVVDRERRVVVMEICTVPLSLSLPLSTTGPRGEQPHRTREAAGGLVRRVIPLHEVRKAPVRRVAGGAS